MTTNKTIRTGILITADAKGAIRQVSLTDDELKKLNNTQAKSRAHAKELSDQWGKNVKQLAAWGSASAVLAGVVVKSNINMQDSYAKTSQRVGVAVETLVGYTHAAALADVSNEQLNVGLRQLNKNVLDFSKGTGEARVAFQGLSIDVTDASGKLKSNDQILLEIADRFSQMENGAEKTGYAMRIFGESGAQLIPFLNQGSDGLAKLVEEGQRYNPVTEESAHQAERFNDSLTRVKGEITSVTTSLVNGLLPGLADFSEQTVAYLQSGGLEEILNGSRIAAESLSIILVSRLVGSSIAAAAAQGQLATATTVTTAAYTRFITLLGGPWGAATIAAAGATYLMVQRHKEAAEAAQAHALAVASVTDGIGMMSEAELAAAAVQRNTRMNELRSQIEALEESESGRVRHTEAIRKLNLELEMEQSNYETLVRHLRRVQAGWKPVNKSTDEAVDTTAELTRNLEALNRVYANSAGVLGITAKGYVELMEASGATFPVIKEGVDEVAKGTKAVELATSKATDSMIRDWQNVRQSFGEFFADLVLDGDNAFDALLRSWERTAYQMAGNKLFDMGASMMGVNVPGGSGSTTYGAFESVLSSYAGKFGAGLTKSGAVITDAEFQQLMGGKSTKTGFNMTDLKSVGMNIGAGIAGSFAGNAVGEGVFGKEAESGIGATAGGMIGSIWGPLGTFIGSAIGSMVDVAFGGDGKKRQNVGFLAGDTPGLKSEYDAGDHTFASGLSVKLFARRADAGSAREILDVFDQVDRSFVDLVKALGGDISVSALAGLDEEANPGSHGNFFGVGGNGATQGDILQQVNSYIGQLADNVSGLDQELLNSVRSASTAEDTLALLTTALAKQTAEQQEATQSAEDAAKAAEVFSDITGGLAEKIKSLRYEQEQLVEQQIDGVRKYWEEIHNRQTRLFASLQSYTQSLRLGDLSGLTHKEQLAAAKGEFDALAGTALNKSLGMDQRLAAAEMLQGAATDYLREYRETNASAGYGGVFDSVMQTLESAKFLGTRQPFEGSSNERSMLQELQRLNDQVGMLPPDIATQLAPIISGFIFQSKAAGISDKVIANTLKNQGSEVVSAVDNSAYFKDFITNNATDDESIVAYVKAQRDAHGVNRTSLMNIRAKALEQGISANYIGSLLGYGPTETQQALQMFGVSTFARGGNHVGGSRIVGEQGWEIESTGPSRIYSHQQSVAMVDGGQQLVSKMDQVIQRLDTLIDVEYVGNEITTKHLGSQLKELGEIKGNMQSRHVLGSGVPKYANQR